MSTTTPPTKKKPLLPGWLSYFKPIILAALYPLLHDRLLHTPEADLPGDAASAGVTPEQFRAVEAVQATKVTILLSAL